MADIFSSKEVQALLKDKTVVLLGDSNTRAVYKDLICLYQKNALITAKVLKSKMERSIFNDELVEHGKLSKGRDYVEHRKFCSAYCKISFYFITKVYSSYVEKILKSFQERGSPDILIMNSTLWDICRWGPKGVEAFKKNLKTLMQRFREVLSQNCIVIWVTTPPVSQEMRGGFLIDQLEFLAYSLRFHILEANSYARRVVVDAGYDVVDAHYHLQMQLTKRADDGIHWVPLAVRHVTNLILTHISLAWGVPLPRRIDLMAPHKMSSATGQNGEVSGSNGSSLGQDAPPDDCEVLALKDIENRHESLVQKRQKKTNADSKAFDETYHGFQVRERRKQALRNNRQRGRSVRPQPFSHPSHESCALPRPQLCPYPPPYYPSCHPPVQQHPCRINYEYYQRYTENSPAPYAFSNPEYVQPNFNWTEMRHIQFGRGPSHWHPR